MTGKYKGAYKDGEAQINNTTWSIDAKNPEAASGETFNQQTWKHAAKAQISSTWAQVGQTITEASWNAIYAKTDKEFYSIIDKAKKQADSYGYAKCVKWSQDESKTRYNLEQKENKSK